MCELSPPALPFPTIRSWKAVSLPISLKGRMPLPGGVIYEGHSWIVEHCVGPFGVGTLLVKSKRHVTRVSQLKVERFAERARNAF
jgi:hypothetical protein